MIRNLLKKIIAGPWKMERRKSTGEEEKIPFESMKVEVVHLETGEIAKHYSLPPDASQRRM